MCVGPMLSAYRNTSRGRIARRRNFFPPILMAAGEVRIRASAVGTRRDLREVLAMAAAWKVCCQVISRPLFQANEVLEELRRGQISGHIVLKPH